MEAGAWALLVRQAGGARRQKIVAFPRREPLIRSLPAMEEWKTRGSRERLLAEAWAWPYSRRGKREARGSR